MIDLETLIHSEGIEFWGIVDAEPADSQVAAQYSRWLAEGRHGKMRFLEAHEPMKYRPDKILSATKSIIVMALSYFPGRNASSASPSATPATLSSATSSAASSPPSAALPTTPISAREKPKTGRISVYAHGRDYHKEFGKRLKRIVKQLEVAFPNERFRSFTDTAPLHERYYAEKAGMVFTGRNTLSLHRELGSFFFLGEILSTRYFEPGPKQEEADDHCPPGCRRCIDICPTGALEGPFRINAAKCISYLTIEHAGSIPKELRRGMGSWLFGCDLCQDVCPFNIRAKVTDVENFRNPLIASEQQLATILALKTHEEFTAIFAGTAVMRAGRIKMVRNALIAAANTDSRELLPQIQQLMNDEDEVIADTARWAYEELENASQI